MSSIDLIRMGLKNLWRRKLRTFLTVLGVIIGTSSIVVMLSLGFGMQESFQNLLSRMGDLTTINVHKPYIGGYGGMSTSTSSPMNNDAKLDDTAITGFQNIPHVVTATPIVETWGTIKTGRYVSNTSIRGIDPVSMKYFEYNISQGRLLEPGDNLVVIFGGSIKNSFYNPQSSGRGRYEEPDIDLMNDRMIFTFDTDVGRGTFPGKNIETPDYEDYKIKAIGMFEEGNPETDYTVYAPIDTVQRMIDEKERAENSNNRNQNRRNEYERVMVKVDDVNNVQDIQQVIKSEGFDAYSLSDTLEEMKKMSSIIQAILGGIGAISLLVAAIGITNTMVMSIYERTKEIGIMKVIGASLKDIKKLFLFESAIIGLLGGLIGIIFSHLLSFILNKFGGNFLMGIGFMGIETESGTNISIIPIWLIFASLSFSVLMGIISGYYPARRAMKLSAIEAIRTE